MLRSFVGTIFEMVEEAGVEWRKLGLDFGLDFFKGFVEGVMPNVTRNFLLTPGIC